jgi:hypothetical protein
MMQQEMGQIVAKERNKQGDVSYRNENVFKDK